ncbi:OmpA family protein [Gynurincola endophyticus]|uniref:OmpA family protein n=1 Tax=Gynurincola endophyticus TaxID=2479004 RepID=UPI000F8D33F9|nr:OmpA family protein [Gynurincola endophyticus]
MAINGYTDNTGDGKHNQTLSEQRANTVLNSLVEAGIETSRLSAKGFGAQNPIADNSTEDGKAKNRRVELVKL